METSKVSTLNVMLFCEFGESTPRQRTIFRRHLLQSGWSSVGVDGHVFRSRMISVNTDDEMLRRTTRDVHAAAQVAEILDWTADCVCSDSPTLVEVTK